MTYQTTPYDTLIAALSAPGNAGLATHTGAAAQAMTLLDAQVNELVRWPVLGPTGPGPIIVPGINDETPEMKIALHSTTIVYELQQCGVRWCDASHHAVPVRAKVTAAAEALVALGSAVQAIDVEAADMADTLHALVQGGKVQEVRASFANVKSGMDDCIATFERTIAEMPSLFAEITNTLSADQMRIEAQIDQIHDQIRAMKSARSVVMGIVTCGTSTSHQRAELHHMINTLRQEEAAERSDFQWASMTRAQCKNARNAANLMAAALLQLDTCVEQVLNDLADLDTGSSDNPAVMAAHLATLKTEFDAAACAARPMLG
ncbi:MAG: hypothetical protein AAFV62_06320 [Pseudomonadota bacterium]